MAKLTVEERDIVIDALVENCACSEATDTDRDSFATLSDHALATLALNAGIAEGSSEEEASETEAEEATEMVAKVKKKKPMTTNNNSLDEFRTSLLAEVKDIVVNSLRESGTREKLVSTITANTRNTFTDKQLTAMDVTSLQAIAALAENGSVKPATKLNFAGSAGIVRNTKSASGKEKPLVAPVMNFSTKTDE